MAPNPSTLDTLGWSPGPVGPCWLGQGAWLLFRYLWAPRRSDSASQMNPPSITVGIPTYRRPGKLRRALDSVLAQSCEPTTIVVGDDGRQEEVRDLVASYHDSRIRYFGRASVFRMTDNWDFVMRWSDGGLVALLEDDNFWRPGHLQHAVDVLERYSEAALYHCAKDDATEIAGILRYGTTRHAPPWHDALLDGPGGIVSTKALLYDALASGSINSSTVIVRRQVLDLVPRFDHRYLMGMDTMMWTRIAMHAPVVYGPWFDVVYTYHTQNVSREELTTRRATIHARAARRLLLSEALSNRVLSLAEFETDLLHLPPATTAPIVILAGDRRQPRAARDIARRVLRRRPEIRRASRHLWLASFVGFRALEHSGTVDRALYLWTQLTRRFRKVPYPP